MYALHTNVYVTKKCNRYCPNCYYWRNLEDMSFDMAERVGKWIADMYKREEVIENRVHILGGEPTLNINSTFALIDTIEKYKPSHTVSPQEGTYVLFTNGDFVLSYLSELRKRKVKVLLNPTTSSLSTIEKRCLEIKEVCGGCSLAIVLDELNMSRLPKLTELAVTHHFHMRVNRLYHGGTIPGYVEEYRTQMRKMFNILLASDWVMWPNFIMESTYPTWSSPKNPNACGRWFIAIDPDGTVRTCNADPDTTVGSIDTIMRMSDVKFSHRWSAKNLPECQECEWITWCQGGCPFTRKLTYGTYDKRSPFCSVFKELFPMLMELKEKWEQSHEKDKRLR